MPEPITFQAYLPGGRDVLRTDGDESKLLLHMSCEDGANLHQNMSRLNGKMLQVAIVPEGEIPEAPQRRGGWGRKRGSRGKE